MLAYRVFALGEEAAINGNLLMVTVEGKKRWSAPRGADGVVQDPPPGYPGQTWEIRVDQTNRQFARDCEALEKECRHYGISVTKEYLNPGRP
jgi:hypothetical protein